MIRLATRRTVWWPTLQGWLIMLAIVLLPAAFWFWQGEDFLSKSTRLPARVLIVEGWIGREGMAAASTEFRQGNYEYIVAAGSLSQERGWAQNRWDSADTARSELIHLGIPNEKVLAASSGETPSQRTFSAALASRQVIENAGFQPKAINVFTYGVHARRSRLVYQKVMSPEYEVGVISWFPPSERNGPWWKSSDRAVNLVKETVGWLFELLLNSGRLSNHRDTAAQSLPSQSQPTDQNQFLPAPS